MLYDWSSVEDEPAGVKWYRNYHLSIIAMIASIRFGQKTIWLLLCVHLYLTDSQERERTDETALADRRAKKIKKREGALILTNGQNSYEGK